MNKKGFSLSLETVVVAIIVLIVLILVAFFVLKYGGLLGSSLRDQANNSIALLPKPQAP
jgi:hypothetical protein